MGSTSASREGLWGALTTGEFLSSYGLWILIVAVLASMHWFGRGCGASHRSRDDARDGEAGGETAAHASRRSGGCH